MTGWDESVERLPETEGLHKLWLGGSCSAASIFIDASRRIGNQLILRACSSFSPGFLPGQAAGGGSVPGVLGLHVGEEHPQRLPYCRSGMHEQTPARRQSQPRPPPLQEAPAPPQQDGAAPLHIQQGQIQELQHHVRTADLLLGTRGRARRGGVGGGPGCEKQRWGKASILFSLLPENISPSLSQTFN